MPKHKPKLPQLGGAQRAMEIIKKFRNQQPSDRLVKIISEYGKDSPSEKNTNSSKKSPLAATSKDIEV